MLSKREIEKVCDEHGLELSKDEVEALHAEQDAMVFHQAGSRALGREQIQDEIERAKKEGRLDKDALKEIFARGDLSEKEMRRLARENGIELDDKDL